MAEQIPHGVATSLFNRSASEAFREFGRINGVMDELERLKDTVEVIKAVLLDAENKQEKNAVQIWARRLKDVFFHADDLIDEFVIEDMRYKRDKAEKNKVTKQTNNVSKETGSYVLESNIIGREKDKKEIINLLRKSHGNQNISLVAIVGMGGLGKTALAQLVYKDEEVQNLFEKRMWVCVSDNFDVKTILKNMLESLTNNKIDDTLSLNILQNMFRDNLTGKRYLLFLDDVWDSKSFEKWDQLMSYLMCGAQGSKVVLTTRGETVAHTIRVNHLYTMKGLTSEQSWGLLKKIIFGDDTVGVNEDLESVGKQIAGKCNGVPLAIKSLRGILQKKSEEREWIDVLQGDFCKLCEDKDSIMLVLKLSYYNLSSQQRQCFAYCSLFPKDWIFDKDELIQMWMAQGYLDCSIEGKCMEDVGNQFVNIFLTNAFFQDAKLNHNGDVIAFKMHDLLHNLATQVSCKDCCYLDNNAKGCLGRHVHVSVERDALESLDSRRLRTLIVFNSQDNKVELVISNFKYLRVWKLMGHHRKLVGSIEKLKHLRYLHLSNCDLRESLHTSFNNLVCLLTIKLYSNVGLSTKTLSKLINLRHLNISNGTFKDETPSGSRKLSIQQHQGLTLSNWLSPLTNIIEICLWSCEGLRYLPLLEHLPFLKSLKLCCLDELEYIYYEEPILHESFFPSLEILDFWDCEKLKGWRRMGDDLNDINSSHHLLLPHFPCLSILTICWCQMLTFMPTFPNIKESCSATAKILEATLNIAESQYSIAFPPLSMLKSFQINETIMDMENVPKDWLKNLTSLENLDFNRLSSEQFEVIEMCFKDDLNCLPFLRTISFFGCQGITRLDMQHLITSASYSEGMQKFGRSA